MARYSVNNYTVETLLSNIKTGSIAYSAFLYFRMAICYNIKNGEERCT